MAIALRLELYSRPLGYFVATALMAAVLAAEIFYLRPQRAYSYFVLFQIMLLGMSLYFTPQLLFPGVVGNDPWAHQAFTTKILEAGHIPAGYSYSKLPIMHLIIGSTSLITNLGYPRAAMLSISLMMVIIFAIFTFLLGRFLGNPKAGLLGALLLIMAPDVLNLGFDVAPTALGMLWILILTYVLFKAKDKKSIILICLTFLFMGVFILSHTITALAMAILLFCLWIGFEIYKMAQKERFEVPVSFYLSILFAVGMFGWWTYASGHMSTFAELIRWGFRVEQWAPSQAAEAYESKVPYSEYLLDILGFLLFYTFAVIGSLSMLSHGSRHKYGFALVLGGFVLVAIAFFSIPLGLTGTLPRRWFSYSQLIMAIPAALGLISVSGLFPNRVISRTLLCMSILAMCFLMTTSSRADFDNPIYTKDLTTRSALTGSELRGMNTLSAIWKGRIAGTQVDISYFQENKGMSVVTTFGSQLYTKDFSESKDAMIVIREEIVVHPFYSEGQLRLDYDPREVLAGQGFSRVYDCGSVTAFLMTK